jgi:hypothetical protein
MYVETQTKKLARTVLLFSASSLCAIILCAAAVPRHSTAAARSVNVPIYTYQNPFGMTASASPIAFLQTKAGSLLTKVVSVKWFLGLSGLGTLWLASAWYLRCGLAKRRHIHRKASYLITDIPVKMNPLAAIPEPRARVLKLDASRPSVLRQKVTRSSFAHRKTTAPCQSRFRPVTLVSSQTRLGHLK